MNSHPTLDQYFKLAIDHKASDVIITTGSRPALKLHGDVLFIEGAPVVSKELAETYFLSISTSEQKEHFQNNLDLDFGFQHPEYGRFRVNAFVNKDGIALIFRPIPEEIPTLDTLGLPEVVKKFTAFKHGLVIVTGATGSGKSTTLAAIVQEINNKKKKHIITIEDPIEFVYTSEKSIVNQREVYSNTRDFHTPLKAALREATDVILVGEMRDPETVSLVLEAAETGALVFATLHTSGAAKAIDRIIDIFPFEKQNQIRSSLALSLKAIVWQELLKRKDKKGRIAACEVLVNNSEVSSMIRKGLTHQLPSAIETGAKDGMVTMKQTLDTLKEEELI
jgi:twitching motility protein PilT